MVTTTNSPAVSTPSTKIQEKRQILKSISQSLKLLLKEGAIDSINEGLINLYAQDGHKTLNTYRQWQKLGYQVKKGSTALMLWGQPKKIDGKPGKPDQQPTDDKKEESFFPIAFVFSNLQVEPIK